MKRECTGTCPRLVIWSVAYNGENRPINWSCGATNIVMKYDRVGRRVEYIEMVTDDSTVATNKHQRFVFDNYLGVERHSVTNGTTALTDVFVWGPTEPIDELGLGIWSFGISSPWGNWPDSSVSYELDDEERKCCSGVKVLRYVRKFLTGGQIGPYFLDRF